MSNIAYRPEIDGLRAVAVLSVIIFHAGVDAMSGGFIGVDVFFVISGFLITRIILKSIDNQSFSFSDFYARRLKRLLPAAIVLIVMTIVFGAFILSPNRYIELAKSGASSSLFMANIWFMKHSGYFDLSTQISPLVHMWSLSVEEQFYLFYPMLMIAANRIGGIKGIKLFISLTLVTSFVFNIWVVTRSPNFAFYMLPTRAWELAIGASINFVSLPKKLPEWINNVLSYLGVTLIIVGLFIIDHNNLYPGWLALLPSIGTASLIYSLNNHQNIVSKLLTLKPSLFLGKISYSAYLWHWPIVVYYRIYINERAFNLFEVVGLIAASLFAGYISWKYVEEQFRYTKAANKKIFKASRWAISFSIIIGLGVYLSNGFASRMSESQIKIVDDDLMWKMQCTEYVKPFSSIDEEFCVVGVPWEEAKHKGIVWGDSHSQHWAQIIDLVAKNAKASFIIGPRKCPAYLDEAYVKANYPRYPRFTVDCTKRNRIVLDWLQDKTEVDVVILAAAWSGHARMSYNDSFKTNLENSSLETQSAIEGVKASETAMHLLMKKLADKQVLLLADIPRPNKILNECAFSENTWLLRSRCNASDYKFLDAKLTLDWHQPTDELLENLATKYPNVSAIIPTTALCSEGKCSTYVNNELIYKDANHLRRNLQPDTAQALAKIIGLERFVLKLSEQN